jgi:histidinol-phosphate aminotransferase
MRNVIRYINKYDPGVFPEDLERLGIRNVAVLGSNENPYEPSEEVRKAYEESLKDINRYPYAPYTELKEAIAEYVGLDKENIAVGCGASEIINNICIALIDALDRVVIPVPSYTLYVIYAMLRDAEILLPEFANYQIESDRIAELKPKVVFLCSPNNPTGGVVERQAVEEIAESSDYVVLDEAYVEFADESYVDLVSEFDNLIILRSFSKFFGLAGMRVGYAVASPAIIEAIEKIRLPFAISLSAARCAIAAIKSLDYYLDVRNRIVEEREKLFKDLSEIDFLEPYPSKANFILMRVVGVVDLCQKLIKRGIILRDVTGVMGIDGEHVRITVGRPEENDLLISALKDLSCSR